MKKLLAFPVLFLLLQSCSAPQEKATEPSLTPGLADSLFPFKNISSTLINGSHKVSYHPLDSTEKMDFVAPIYFKDMKNMITADYFIHWQTALFISKQDKIGDFTPIIVSIGGDDFDAIYFILLDAENKPLSGLQIGGSGIFGGPEEVSDSLLSLCPVKTSRLNNNIISTTLLRMTFLPDSIKHPTLIDSLTYISKVLPNGRIETTLKDSIRTQRIIY